MTMMMILMMKKNLVRDAGCGTRRPFDDEGDDEDDYETTTINIRTAI